MSTNVIKVSQEKLGAMRSYLGVPNSVGGVESFPEEITSGIYTCSSHLI